MFVKDREKFWFPVAGAGLQFLVFGLQFLVYGCGRFLSSQHGKVSNTVGIIQIIVQNKSG
jgi:hypothetical protein